MPEALIARLNEQAAALKQSSERLASLADQLPKHGATVHGLSRTLLSGSQFLEATAVHILRDSTAA